MKDERENGKDSSRHHLVTTFVCAECGYALRLSYAVPIESCHDSNANTDGFTGSKKVDARIAIHPCEKCYGALTQPLIQLKAALEAM